MLRDRHLPFIFNLYAGDVVDEILCVDYDTEDEFWDDFECVYVGRVGSS